MLIAPFDVVLIAPAAPVVTVPVPVAVNVAVDPCKFAFTTMPLFVPVSIRLNAPLAVIVLPAPTVMLPLLAVSVSENIAPVDVPFIVVDAESVM
jgi:hypothetical protein